MLSAFSYSRKWMEQWETRKKENWVFLPFKMEKATQFSEVSDQANWMRLWEIFFFSFGWKCLHRAGCLQNASTAQTACQSTTSDFHPSIVIICLWMNTKEQASFRSWGNWIKIYFLSEVWMKKENINITFLSLQSRDFGAPTSFTISRGLCCPHWMIAKRNWLFHEYFMNVFYVIFEYGKKYKLGGFVNKSSGLKGKSNPTEKVFKALSELAAQRGISNQFNNSVNAHFPPRDISTPTSFPISPSTFWHPHSTQLNAHHNVIKFEPQNASRCEEEEDKMPKER